MAANDLDQLRQLLRSCLWFNVAAFPYSEIDTIEAEVCRCLSKSFALQELKMFEKIDSLSRPDGAGAGAALTTREAAARAAAPNKVRREISEEKGIVFIVLLKSQFQRQLNHAR